VDPFHQVKMSVRTLIKDMDVAGSCGCSAG